MQNDAFFERAVDREHNAPHFVNPNEIACARVANRIIICSHSVDRAWLRYGDGFVVISANLYLRISACLFIAERDHLACAGIEIHIEYPTVKLHSFLQRKAFRYTARGQAVACSLVLYALYFVTFSRNRSSPLHLHMARTGFLSFIFACLQCFGRARRTHRCLPTSKRGAFAPQTALRHTLYCFCAPT